jgi:hypothetical protein
MKRIVTGLTVEGKSVFVSESTPSRKMVLENLPGLEMTEVWSTPSTPRLPAATDDPTLNMTTFVPPVGGTQFRFVQFPPDQQMLHIIERGISLESMRQEYLSKAPGLADLHEAADIAMHTTDTIDYGIVLTGEIWLELDEGAVVHLKAGDCVIQNGTRHAWRNRSDKPCLIAFVMIGAARR